MLGMISCKEATYLLVQKEEVKLTLSQRFKLKLHMVLCKVCALFERQSVFIGKHARKMEQEHTHEAHLDGAVKQRITDSLKG